MALLSPLSRFLRLSTFKLQNCSVLLSHPCFFRESESSLKMQNALPFKSQFLGSNGIIFLNPFLETTLSLQSFNWSSKCLTFSHKYIQKPVICARKSTRYERSTKILLELISVLASDLKILPQPLDLVVRNFVHGDAEGLGFFNGFKGVSFTGWRKRKRRTNARKLLGFSAFLGSCILCMWLGKELRGELVLGLLGFGFFVASLFKEWRRGLKIWIFGCCCVGVLVGLGLSGNKTMKSIKEISISSSSQMMEMARRGRRRGRWTL